MKTAARVVSVAALAATIAPPVLYFTGAMTVESMRAWMLVATAAWFAATPVWMQK
jgi:hypothetical protein